MTARFIFLLRRSTLSPRFNRLGKFKWFLTNKSEIRNAEVQTSERLDGYSLKHTHSISDDDPTVIEQSVSDTIESQTYPVIQLLHCYILLRNITKESNQHVTCKSVSSSRIGGPRSGVINKTTALQNLVVSTLCAGRVCGKVAQMHVLHRDCRPKDILKPSVSLEWEIKPSCDVKVSFDWLDEADRCFDVFTVSTDLFFILNTTAIPINHLSWLTVY